MTTLFLALSTPPKDCTSVQGQRPSPRFQVSGRGRGVSERGVPPEVRKAGGFLGSDLPSLGRCPRGPDCGGCGGGGEDTPGSGSALPAITARLIFLGGLSRSRLLLRAPSGVHTAGSREPREGAAQAAGTRMPPGLPRELCLGYPPPHPKVQPFPGLWRAKVLPCPTGEFLASVPSLSAGEATVHLGSRRAARRVGPSQEPRGDPSTPSVENGQGTFPTLQKNLFKTYSIFFSSA